MWNQWLLIVCYNQSQQPQSIFAPRTHPTYTANMGVINFLPQLLLPMVHTLAFVLRTCSDVTQAYRSFKCPYNFLGTKHQDLFFNGDQNLKKHGIPTKSSLIFLPIFCLIQNCFKHPTFSNYCIFSIKFCQYNQNFYYSKIQYCLNVHTYNNTQNVDFC